MVIFEYIKWKNLLSTGSSWTTIYLNRSSTTLIVGKNGSGKSTVLDALCFVLFNKPFRNINKPNIINSINGSECMIECGFTVGKEKYKIVRGIKPNIFEIYKNDKLIPQDSANLDYQDYLEKFILKMNMKSFTQIVILGSASFTPFMQLKTADRRAIIEDLLDIQIFSAMNSVIKQKISLLDDQMKSAKSELEMLDVRIEASKKIIDQIKHSNQQKIDANNEEIKRSQEQIKNLTDKITDLQNQITGLQSRISNHSKLKTTLKELNAFGAKIDGNKKRAEKEIMFFENNSMCPSCHQDIDQELKQENIQKNTDKIHELSEGLSKLHSQMNKIEAELKKVEFTIAEISRCNESVVKYNTMITSTNKYIVKLQREISEIENSDISTSSEEKNIEEYRNKKEKLHQTKEELLVRQQYLDVAITLLKDTGIKTRIIKQYIPIINKLVNKYLNAMDFFVNFTLDENFDETIKSRHRDEFAYENFSEGEKQKIDLALLFTWREVARLKNSASCNFLILDEVFDSSLDSNATEELLKILNGFDEKTNIFVISHKDDVLFDKFRSVIKFETVGGFSRIV